MGTFIYYWRYMVPSIDLKEEILVQGLYPYTEKQVDQFKNSNKVKVLTKDCIIKPDDVRFSKMVKYKDEIPIDSKFFIHFRHDVIEHDFID